ncbi:MAG TPA: nucleotide sugar dehydrogenase [Candidatus Cloacimonadota bacterium]|nr:nucleotide sugar dehydrogenase [Candidatus Cloacimonadota bacterium]
MKQSINLAEKIKAKQSVVAVIGLGYVGLPLAVTVAKKGFKVIGIDVNTKNIESVNAGKNYIGDVDDADLENCVKNGYLHASNDYSNIKNADVVVIAVPSPLDKYHQPDMKYIISAITSIVENLTEDTLVVLESTTYPGTTHEIIVPPIVKKGFVVGETVYVAFSPERVDPGNKDFKTNNTPKVVGGETANCNIVAKAFYENVLDSNVHLVSSPAVAEMEKIFENTFRNINIALSNEMTILCERMGINFWEVIDAAKTKPYGFMAFYPGPGVGGHCIPIDPFYLTWKAREYSYHTRMIELAGEINMEMPNFVLNKAIRLLNQSGKALSEAKVLLLGAAYKKDIEDVRESPIQNLMVLLEEWNANFDYYDPWIPSFKNPLNQKSYTSTKQANPQDYDIVIIMTDHSDFNYEEIVGKAKIVLDTRNAAKNVKSDKIVLL